MLPLLALALAVASTTLVADHSIAGKPLPAKLTIIARGATLEFRTMNLPRSSFTLNDGSSRTFNRLAPGRYVVVQAPPWGGGMQMQCSDGVSANQYDLEPGENLTCTFIAS